MDAAAGVPLCWPPYWPKLFFRQVTKSRVSLFLALNGGAHRIPYVATANIAFPEDLVRKVKKAKSIKGSKFLHIFASCPPGWRIPSEMSVKVARMAVQANIFPLYEVVDGVRYTINYKDRQRPVQDYFEVQGRFSHLTAEDFDQIQKMVEEDWELLLRKAGEQTADACILSSGAREMKS